MFEHSHMRSPSQHSHKVYDYLMQHPASNQKYRSLTKSNHPELTPLSKEQAEYELIVQFQLRRQKEKNLILQERLRNKESFIKQMKQFQDELTVTFQKCQEDLQYYKTQCQEYESKWNSFATFNNKTPLKQNANQSLLSEPQIVQKIQEQIVREYLEEIAELKHLVIRLEEEINYYEKKEKAINQSKFLSSSVKNEFYPSLKNNKESSNNFRQTDSRKKSENSPNKKHKQHKYKLIQNQKRQQRSKTLANQFVDQKQQENFTILTNISHFIHDETRKITSFISHFLTMCEFFQQSIEKQQEIKHKLKKAWKWIKTTIVEWNYLKRQKIEKVKEYKIGNVVSKLLPLANLSMPQIEILLEKILKLPQERHNFKRM